MNRSLDRGLPPFDDRVARARDLADCKASLRDGSRTFLAASLLLPASVRDPACALYAFCRQADDAVDAVGATDGAMERLRHRLAAMYRGQPMDLPADRALARVVRDFAVPRGLLEALLEGFEWDRAGRRYETLDELLDYAARVAGTVGAVMSLLMGARSPEAVARACELGCAMQLSNIARDVGEDARMGRLYLPRAWMREAGIEVDAWLARPVFTPELGGVVERLLKVADALYQRVDSGVALLPLSCRPGINAARFLYAEIGQEVRRHGLDSVDRRAVVPPARKLALLVKAGRSLSFSWRPRALQAVPATGFLSEMVAASPHRPMAASPSSRLRGLPDLGARTVRIIDLFEQLEHRRADRRAPGLY